MDTWSKYFFQPKEVNEILNNATVFVDTNVLLAAYQWRDMTFKEVINVLKRLNQEGRLRIPEHVIYEFSKHRPKEIMSRINELENVISHLQPQKPLTQRVPMFDDNDLFKKTVQIHNEYNEIVKEYRNGLSELREQLKVLFHKDPILEELKSIFKLSIHTPDNIESIKELSDKAEKRFKKKIPPGYKDNKKEENSIGDFIVWSHILCEKNDVIIISAEKKEDWVYVDKHKNIVSARRELVEEFYEYSEGKTFCFVSPKKFITLFNPNVSNEVKEDLDEQMTFDTYYENLNDRHKANLLNAINNVLSKHDPLAIASVDENEYNPEAKKVLDLLPKVNNVNGLLDGVYSVFVESFDTDLAGLKIDYLKIAKEIYELKLFLDFYNKNRE